MICESLTEVMRLLEFTDSAFPVGTFSFSNGLETAAETGEVFDRQSLGEYARDAARRSATTDCVAALHSHRGCCRGDYAAVVEADESLWLCKLNTEARLMTQRMGHKIAELASRILNDNAVWQRFGSRWMADIADGRVRGTHPVTAGLLFAACGLSEQELFCSLWYGALNTVLSAALRCVRVSHYDTQRLLFDLGSEAGDLYNEAAVMELGDMNAFAPFADIMASLHEKGNRRMFMN